MLELRYADAFVREASAIRLASKRQELRSRIEMLVELPQMGSSNLPQSIIEQYGPNVRKLVVSPFIVVYEINLESSTVDVLGLVHQRAAW